MKQALKRIEEALNQLETRKNAANAQPDTAKRSYSFDLLKPPKSNSPKQTKEVATPELPYLNALGNSHLPAEETLEVSSLPEHLTEDSDDRTRVGGAQGAGEQKENSCLCAFATDTLPPVGNPPSLVSSSLRDTNPKSKIQNPIASSFNDGVLIQNHATCSNAVEPSSKSQNSGVSSDKAIEQVVHQIQELYHSGPIVDGYLEYYPPAPEPGDPTLREVCFERVIDNLEEVGMTSGQEIGLPGASYRICGVDASGQQWSYPCPLDQLPSVSMAIARYQKLQQLLQQKHELEKGLEARD